MRTYYYYYCCCHSHTNKEEKKNVVLLKTFSVSSRTVRKSYLVTISFPYSITVELDPHRKKQRRSDEERKEGRKEG